MSKDQPQTLLKVALHWGGNSPLRQGKTCFRKRASALAESMLCGCWRFREEDPLRSRSLAPSWAKHKRTGPRQMNWRWWVFLSGARLARGAAAAQLGDREERRQWGFRQFSPGIQVLWSPCPPAALLATLFMYYIRAAGRTHASAKTRSLIVCGARSH